MNDIFRHMPKNVTSTATIFVTSYMKPFFSSPAFRMAYILKNNGRVCKSL